MLALTETARSAIRALADQQSTPETSGVRIYSRDTETPLVLTMAAAPEAGDETVEADGARVFLDRTAVRELQGSMLDASLADGRLRFQITSRH